MFQENFWSIRHSISRLFSGLTLGQLNNSAETIDGSGVESLYGKVESYHDQHLFNIIPNWISISFGVVLCLILEPVVGFGFLGYVALMRWWSTRQNRYITIAMEPIDAEFRRWRRWVSERWESINIIKWNGVEQRFLSTLHDSVQPTLAADDYVWRIRFARMITGRRLAGTAATALCAYGLSHLSLVSERVSTAEFMWLILVLQHMVLRLQDISDAERIINRDDASITGYRKPLQVTPDFDPRLGTEFIDDHVGFTLENVHLSLGDSDTAQEILRNVSFSITPGERVAIVGPSGAGKSKLIDIMLRALDPTSGTVYINTTPLSELALETFARKVGFIPQDMVVYEGTIRENVLEGISHLDWSDDLLTNDELVWAAIRRAGLDDVRLEDGLATKVGYRGIKLSGGQKQRLAIAAALVKDPLVVVGDEMTSALDSVSEAHILEELETKLSKATTLIMIAHRLSTLHAAQKVIFVEPCTTCTQATNVRVYPTFAAVMEHEPIFRTMAKAQGFTPHAPHQKCAKNDHYHLSHRTNL